MAKRISAQYLEKGAPIAIGLNTGIVYRTETAGYNTWVIDGNELSPELGKTGTMMLMFKDRIAENLITDQERCRT